MKKVISLILAMLVTLGAFSFVSAAEQRSVYVATDGSDANSGTIDSPFATVKKAVEAVKGEKSAVIYMRGGTYVMNETIEMDESNSNLEIRSYNGEKVALSGAYTIPASSFKKIDDEAVKNRIVDKNARDKVLVSDLKELGITEYGKIHYFGLYFADYFSEAGDPALYCNGKMMTVSRYPNDDYINVDSVVENGYNPGGISTPEEDRFPFSMKTNDKRVEKWKEANDPWIYGYFRQDYADGAYAVKIDYDNGNTITTLSASCDGVDKDRRFYFFNLLEETDMPGEWYLDRENGKLYFYPEGDISKAELSFSCFPGYMFKINNAKNIRFADITFKDCTGAGIFGANCDNIDVDSCEFTNLQNDAVWLEKTNNSKIRNCHAYGNGSSVFYVEGGDEKTLTHSGNIVTNNHIEDYGKIKGTYQPAIDFRGVGNVISHNKIHNAPHFAVQNAGQEHVFEYNEIYDVCKDSSDAGALYYGQEIHEKGNIIRYNYFHDMTHIDSNQGMKIWGVYLDDGFSSASVYGNVFDRVSGVALYGGGRNNTFENNLMLNCDYPFTMDARRTWDGWSWLSDGQKWVWERLDNIDLKNGVWAERYPELAEMRGDEPDYPKYNVIRNNVSYNVPEMDIDKLVKEYGTVENNIQVLDTKAFADYRNKDYTILEDSEVYEKIPDWKAIPYDKIGLITEHDKIAEQSVILKIGSSKAIAMGKETAVDTANANVKPQIINGRTLVPARFIAESFGAEVGWDDATKTVSISCGGKEIKMILGSTELVIDGNKTQLDVPAQSIEGRTMIPLRVIAEALGKEVFWDDKGLIVMSDDEIVDAENETVIDLLIRKVD